jgi:hypothetical protein
VCDIVHKASFCSFDRVQPRLRPREAVIDLQDARVDREAACPEGNEVCLGLGCARGREAAEARPSSRRIGVGGRQQPDTFPLPVRDERRDDQLPALFLHRP